MFIADSHSSRVNSVRGHAGGSRLRARVRRLVAATAFGVALMAVVGAPGALAAGQQHNHFRDIGTDVDPDFCGTGQEIDIAFNVLVNEWLAPHKADFKTTASGKIIFTNPLTGDTVISRFAGPTWVTTVSGDPEGLHVEEVTTKGLPELFKLPHGGVLTRDAGYIVLRNTFDGDEFISTEIVVNKGPHPEAESDFELVCEILPPALGI
jgi:hypothetical protein